jgi:hypothetical protein
MRTPDNFIHVKERIERKDRENGSREWMERMDGENGSREWIERMD